MVAHHKKYRSGATLIELILVIVIAVIPVLVVGVLLVRGQKQWSRTYNIAHKQLRLDADAVTVALGHIGRKSNRFAYEIYNYDGNNFTPAQPEPGQTRAEGEAVEFRYWDAAKPDSSLLDVTNTGTHYALFYARDENLYVDYGQVAAGVGAISGSSKTTPDSTVTLARNVNAIKFSHETLNGAGQGCVRIDLTLKDPDDDETVRVTTATLLRNMWPR